MDKNQNIESVDAIETENTAEAIETQNAASATELEKKEKKTWFSRELSILLFLLAVTSFALAMSLQILLKNPGGASPGLFPTICSCGMAICLVSAVLQAWKKKSAEKSAKSPDNAEAAKGWESFKVKIGTEIPFTVFIMIVAAVLYAVLITFVGFYVSTGLYLLFSIVFLYHGTHWKQAVFVTAGFLVAIFLIIELLFKVPMP